MSSKRFVYLKDVVTLRLDQKACSGCGLCLEVCPHAVFARRNGTVRVDTRDACMECGACARNCPASAITVHTGVGCAAAVISSALGAKSSSCSCTIEPDGVKSSECQM